MPAQATTIQVRRFLITMRLSFDVDGSGARIAINTRLFREVALGPGECAAEPAANMRISSLSLGGAVGVRANS